MREFVRYFYNTLYSVHINERFCQILVVRRRMKLVYRAEVTLKNNAICKSIAKQRFVETRLRGYDRDIDSQSTRL
jgi:hypothetical protein